MLPYLFFYGYAVLIGLFIGSFLNVVALRMLQGQSIAYPPSHCDHCKERLKPWDLIPVFSYLALRGKCRKCQTSISAAYPVGEAAAGLLFGITAWIIGLNWELLVGWFFVSILIAVVQTDLRARIIPNKITYFAMAAGLLLRLWLPQHPWWDHVLAGAAAGGLFFLLAVLSKGGVGGGDIKLFVFIGFMLGLSQTALAIFLACLFGTLFGAGLWLAKRYKRGMQVPFAPFIAAGSLIAYYWGEPLIALYISFIQG